MTVTTTLATVPAVTDDDAQSVDSDQSMEPTLEEKFGKSNRQLNNLNIDLFYHQQRYDNEMSYAAGIEKSSKHYPAAKIRDAIAKLEKAKAAKEEWLKKQAEKQEAKNERKRARMDATREEKTHFELMEADRLKRFENSARTFTKRAKFAAADAVVAEKKRDPNASKEQLDDIVDKAFKKLHNVLSFPLPGPDKVPDKAAEADKPAETEAEKPVEKKE